MRVLITGTPGTGKSTVAKELARRMGWRLVSIASAARADGLVEGRGHEVDVKKLKAALLKRLRGLDDFIVEGHLGCEFRLPVDCVFVLRTAPAELEKRLKSRNYPAGKTEENLMSELLDYCLQLSEANYAVPVLQLDTTKATAVRTARRISDFLNGKVKTLDNVWWGRELREKTKGNP